MNKKTKRIIAVIAVLCLTLAMTGCAVLDSVVNDI